MTVAKTVDDSCPNQASAGMSWPIAVQYYQRLSGALGGFRFRYRKVWRFKSSSSHSLKNRRLALAVGAAPSPQTPTVANLWTPAGAP